MRDADTMIGTSAGSMVAAHLRVGTDEGNAFARIQQGAPLASYGRLGPSDAARYLRAQLHARPPRRGGPSSVGAALLARTTSEEEWLDAIGLGLVGKAWPEGRLFITAVDAESGASVVFDNHSGVPLERAVAASCAVPGVFPAVEIAGRRYVDGGLRSIGNIDLAAGHHRVLALSPYPVGPRLRDLPALPAPRTPAARKDAPRRPGPQGHPRHGGEPARHEPWGRHLRDRSRPRAPDRGPRLGRSGPTDRHPAVPHAPLPAYHRLPPVLLRVRPPPVATAPEVPMAALESLPLIRLPESWPLPVVAALCMAALAGLDLLGAVAAKEWAERQDLAALAFGALSFLVLFWVYASSLQYAELAVVTMGWIVLLQVGIVLVDRLHFGSTLSADKVAALVVILAAQGYLLLAPSGTAA